jgi:hypothetical protein
LPDAQKTVMTSKHYEDEEAAGVCGEIDAEGHLQPNALWGTQTAIFDISMSGSLEQLQKNGAASVWSLDENVQQKNLRAVMSKTNRNKPIEADMVGDISKTIWLQATVIEQQNDYPVPVGIDVDGLVARSFTQHSRHNWVIRPNTPTMAVNQSIFDPNNMFTRRMYATSEKLDTASLRTQIRVDPSGSQATIDPNGIAYEILMTNWQKGILPEYHDYLTTINSQILQQPAARHVSGVQIPVALANQLIEAIEPELKRVESSFVDMRTIKARFTRADNEENWNSLKNLVGEAAGAGDDELEYVRQAALNQVHHASIKLRVEYIVY